MDIQINKDFLIQVQQDDLDEKLLSYADTSPSTIADTIRHWSNIHLFSFWISRHWQDQLD
jgi:hypothetical protein